MSRHLIRSLVIGVSLWASGCSPCGFGHPVDRLGGLYTSGFFHNLNSPKVADVFAFADQSITVYVSRALLQEAPGVATYTLEVYNPAACPPEPSAKLSDFGSAKDTGSSTDDAVFLFGSATREELQALSGKMLVLRASDPAKEPVAAVSCLSEIYYHPDYRSCAGD